MSAAALHLEAAASNIANARSTGALPDAPNPGGRGPAYTPMQIVQTASANGGVTASISPSTSGALLQYDPSAPYANSRGLVGAPDVTLEDQMLELVTARYSFAANLAVARTDNEMADALLHIRV